MKNIISDCTWFTISEMNHLYLGKIIIDKSMMVEPSVHTFLRRDNSYYTIHFYIGNNWGAYR